MRMQSSIVRARTPVETASRLERVAAHDGGAGHEANDRASRHADGCGNRAALHDAAGGVFALLRRGSSWS
jgi:hypothetical protein